MVRGEGLAIAAALAAALISAGPVAGTAMAGPACPATAASEAIVTGVSAAGTLVTAEGSEIVLAGLAFPQASDAARIRRRRSASRRRDCGPRHRGCPAGGRRSPGPLRPAPGRCPCARWPLAAGGARRGRPRDRAARWRRACLRARAAAFEASARRARAGLWTDSKIVAKATDESSLLAKSGLYGLVEGRVVSVGYGSRMVFLDFGRSFRTDFTVMVPMTLVPRLVEAGITVESLAGRAIRVRGVIEETGGPAIRLTDPLALELLDREE